MRRDDATRRYVTTIHRYARMHFMRTMAPYGVPDSAFPYLLGLYREDDISQDELAQFHHTDKATAARAVATLEAAGLVTRKQDADDRRVKRVRLTPKAKRLEPKLTAILAKWSSALTEGFTRTERETALELLQRMAENARRVVEETN